MYRLSLVLAAIFGSIAVLSTACIVSGPATDDDDDSPVGISCATADEAWSTCAAVTGSPTPAPFCASLAAGSIGADSDWGCIAALLGQWDCATGLPSSLEEFGTCINLDPGGDDDDSISDDDDSISDDDDSVPSGPCTDDTSEPNDDVAQATPITAGTHTGYVSCDDNDDYFSISIDAGRYLQVDLTFVDDDGDIELSIQDASGTSLDSAFSSTDNETAAFLSDTTATYYIVVRMAVDPNGYGNNYDITVATGTPGPEICDDGIDNDFDDSFNNPDGGTDCEDLDCEGHASCVEGDGVDNCGDGEDNDADGDTDCADSGCAAESACICATDQFEENDSYNAPKPIPAGTYGVYDPALITSPVPSDSCTNCLNTCLGDEDWYSFSWNGAPGGVCSNPALVTEQTCCGGAITNCAPTNPNGNTWTPDGTITLNFHDAWGDLDCKLYDADEAGWTPDPNDPNWEPNLTMSTQPGYIPTLARSTGVGDSEDCSTAATLAANGNYLLNVYFYTSLSPDLEGFGNNYALNISY